MLAVNFVCLLLGDGGGSVQCVYQSFFTEKQLPAVSGSKADGSGNTEPAQCLMAKTVSWKKKGKKSWNAVQSWGECCWSQVIMLATSPDTLAVLQQTHIFNLTEQGALTAPVPSYLLPLTLPVHAQLLPVCRSVSRAAGVCLIVWCKQTC